MRSVGGAIAGYICMALTVFALFTVAMYGLSIERVYKPQSWAHSQAAS